MALIITICSNQFSPSNFIEFVRPANLKIGIANNDFTITQRAKSNPVYLNASNILTFSDSSRNRNIIARASNFLSFQSQVVKPILQIASNYIPFIQSAHKGALAIASNNLNIVQTLQLAKGLVSPFNILQSAIANIRRKVGTVNILDFKSEASVYKSKGDVCG